MAELSVREPDLRNKRIFMRVDFNVPLSPGGQEITSDKRIKAEPTTIKYALEQGAGLSDKVSHFSTGGGASLEFLSGLVLPAVAALTDR